jgi:hypothetical protein
MNKLCKQCGKELYKKTNKFCSFECYCKYPKSKEQTQKFRATIISNGGFKTGKDNPLFGVSVSEDHKLKQSIAMKKKYESGEIVAWNKNKKMSKEFIEKNRISHEKNKFEVGKKSGETRKKRFAEGKIKIWNNGIRGLHLNPKDEFKKGMIPWNKGTKGVMNPWNKGKLLPQFSGENHPNWNGGSSFQPYGLSFNRMFKKLIKERDGGCMLCNLSIEDLHLLKRKIHVHHIDYSRNLHIKENCCALCNSCHSKSNFNRKQWTTFFHSLLSEKYGYQYSEDGKIIINLNGGTSGENI